MIKLVLVVSFSGSVRLSRFYEQCPVEPHKRQQLVSDLHSRIACRSKQHCNFVDVSDLMGPDSVAVYRPHNRMFVVFVVDGGESLLAICDVIQEFMTAIKSCVGSGGELDFVFHSDLVNHVLNEMVQGGMVMVTTATEAARSYRKQRELVVKENKTLASETLEAVASLAAFSSLHPI